MGLSQSQCKDELWQRTSGVIHLHLGRVARSGARSHVSTDCGAMSPLTTSSNSLCILQKGRGRGLYLCQTQRPSRELHQQWPENLQWFRISTRYFITVSYLKIYRHWTENGCIYWVTLTRLELCTSIINVCTAAEDSCMAPGWRITAPTLSFLKHRLWGALLNSGATKYPAAQPP